MNRAFLCTMFLYSFSFAASNADTMMSCIPPNYAPRGGSFSAPVQVTISCGIANSTIYYTLRNSLPSWQQYISPVLIQQSDTLRSYATAPGFMTSSILSEVYSIQPVNVFSENISTIKNSNKTCNSFFALNGQKHVREIKLFIKKYLFNSKKMP